MSVTITSVSGTDIKALGNIPLSEDMYTKGQVETRLDAFGAVVSEEIASAISTVWKAGGAKAATDLTSSLLVAANEGYVYNLTTDATTTSDWLEGAGKTVLAGTDVAVVKSGSDYYFNALAPVDGTVVRGAKLNGTTNVNPESGRLNFAAGDNISLSVSGGSANNVTVISVSGIASGAEVNQNAFSKIAVSGVTGTGDASSKTDTLTLIPGDNVTMTRNGKSVTIGATVPTGVVKKVGTVAPDASGNVPVVGENGIYVSSGTSGLTIDGGSLSGDISGLSDTVSGLSDTVCGLSGDIDTLSGSVTGLANFSQITIKDSSGVTCGTLSPISNDDTLIFQAGGSVTLENSCGTIVISVDVPVTDVRISGTSIVSNGTADIPHADTSTPGVVQISNTLTSGCGAYIIPSMDAVWQINDSMSEKVSGGTLHTNLVSNGHSNPSTTPTSGTIYSLIKALHASDNTSES